MMFAAGDKNAIDIIRKIAECSEIIVSITDLSGEYDDALAVTRFFQNLLLQQSLRAVSVENNSQFPHVYRIGEIFKQALDRGIATDAGHVATGLGPGGDDLQAYRVVNIGKNGRDRWQLGLCRNRGQRTIGDNDVSAQGNRFSDTVA